MAIETKPSTITIERKTGEALLWLDDMCSSDKWDLTRDQVCRLLGDMPKRSFSNIMKKAKETREASVSRDTYDRLSILLGIHKALELFAPSGRSLEFFSKKNTGAFFDGKSPKEYLLLDGSIQSLLAVKSHLRSLN